MDHRMFTNGKPPAFYSSEQLIFMSKPELIKMYTELQDAARRYEKLLMEKKDNQERLNLLQKQVEDIEILEAFSL